MHIPYQCLGDDEREEISRGLSVGQPYADIARYLARPTSAISREVNRHGGRMRYRAARESLAARRAAWRYNKSHHTKRCLLLWLRAAWELRTVILSGWKSYELEVAVDIIKNGLAATTVNRTRCPKLPQCAEILPV